MKNYLVPGEIVFAESGYPHEKCATPIIVPERKKSTHSLFRAYHITCNARFKCSDIFKHTFRHSVEQRAVVFHAASKIDHTFKRSS